MKALTKLLATLLVLAVPGLVSLIAVVQTQHRRSTREVRETVAQLTPDMPFSAVTSRLRQAIQKFTTADEIRVFGTRQEPSLVTNSILYAFGHRGPPYRWIVVYTARDSKRVLCAGWKDL